MGIFESLKKIYRFSKIVKTLILVDVLAWSITSIMSIIIPIFIIKEVPGGNLTVAGVGLMIFYFAQALSNILSGIFMDNNKGLMDEYLAYIYAMLVRAVAVFSFIWIGNYWLFFIIQIVSGSSQGVIGTAWRAIFTKVSDKKNIATEWSTDLAVINLAMGFFGFFGAFIADEVNYIMPFLASASLAVLGALIMILIRPEIERQKK